MVPFCCPELICWSKVCLPGIGQGRPLPVYDGSRVIEHCLAFLVRQLDIAKHDIGVGPESEFFAIAELFSLTVLHCHCFGLFEIGEVVASPGELREDDDVDIVFCCQMGEVVSVEASDVLLLVLEDTVGLAHYGLEGLALLVAFGMCVLHI
jgi:hypothetical protein